MLWIGKAIVYSGSSMEAAFSVRKALAEAGIDCAYRAVNNTTGSNRALSMGNFTMTYEVRVRQADLARAQQVIGTLTLPI